MLKKSDRNQDNGFSIEGASSALAGRGSTGKHSLERKKLKKSQNPISIFKKKANRESTEIYSLKKSECQTLYVSIFEQF